MKYINTIKNTMIYVLLSLPITIIVITGVIDAKDYWYYDKLATIQLLVSYLIFICCHIFLMIALNKISRIKGETIGNNNIDEDQTNLNLILAIIQNLK